MDSIRKIGKTTATSNSGSIESEAEKQQTTKEKKKTNTIIYFWTVQYSHHISTQWMASSVLHVRIKRWIHFLCFISYFQHTLLLTFSTPFFFCVLLDFDFVHRLRRFRTSLPMFFFTTKGNAVGSVSPFYVQMRQQTSVKLTVWNFHLRPVKWQCNDYVCTLLPSPHTEMKREKEICGGRKLKMVAATADGSLFGNKVDLKWKTKRIMVGKDVLRKFNAQKRKKRKEKRRNKSGKSVGLLNIDSDSWIK